jgi:hypothetical protein
MVRPTFAILALAVLVAAVFAPSTNAGLVCLSIEAIKSNIRDVTKHVANSGLPHQAVACFAEKVEAISGSPQFMAQTYTESGNVETTECFDKDSLAVAVGSALAACLPAVSAQPSERAAEIRENAAKTTAARTSVRMSAPRAEKLGAALLLSGSARQRDTNLCYSGQHYCCSLIFFWIGRSATEACLANACGCQQCGWCSYS